jgi:hypothetical protein
LQLLICDNSDSVSLSSLPEGSTCSIVGISTVENTSVWSNSNFVFSRAIPQLVWNRQNWDILFPSIDSNDETDVENLTSTRYYIAGFTDASVENRHELYDIFANSKYK